jgi:hypothetical protein
MSTKRAAPFSLNKHPLMIIGLWIGTKFSPHHVWHRSARLHNLHKKPVRTANKPRPKKSFKFKKITCVDKILYKVVYQHTSACVIFSEFRWLFLVRIFRKLVTLPTKISNFNSNRLEFASSQLRYSLLQQRISLKYCELSSAAPVDSMRYSLRSLIRSRLRQRHGHQSTTLTSLFYKKIYSKVIYVYSYKVIVRWWDLDSPRGY